MSGSQLIGRRRIWVEGLTPLLGGSWVVISIVISPPIWVITIAALLTTAHILHTNLQVRALHAFTALYSRRSHKAAANKEHGYLVMHGSLLLVLFSSLTRDSTSETRDPVSPNP